jgi:hypothetical protein
MIERIASSCDDVLAYKITGKVTLDEYLGAEKEWLAAIEEKGKIKMLIELGDLQFPELKVFFEDFKQGMKHCKDFSAFCVIGDHTWEKVWSNVFSTIMHINLKYFDVSQCEAAWEWIKNE